MRWIAPASRVGVWAAPPTDVRAVATALYTAPSRACDEAPLVADAQSLLRRNFDVELGAVAPGSPADVGFQYLKTVDALLAAQAVAHQDFDRAAFQFRRVISHQRQDGSLPLIVYGPSVDTSLRWIASDKTFLPGPAFWINANANDTSSNVANDSGSIEGDEEMATQAPGPRLPSSSLLAPPIAADVAWQMYRLSPYETTMGVVGHTASAVEFLCDVYPTLRTIHHHVFTSHRPSNETALLAAQHPWETLSSFSSHWKEPLRQIKSMPGYAEFVTTIPLTAKARFSQGAVLEGLKGDPVGDFYEPMMYLASCFNSSSDSSFSPDTESPGASCALRVHDVEFNALVLRSADALADIGRVLVDRSSLCPNFRLETQELLNDISAISAQAASLREAVAGNVSMPSRLWNATAQLFSDDDSHLQTDWVASLRGVMPAYAVRLEERYMMGILSHFLPSSDTFQFLCARYPTSFFSCDSSSREKAVTLLHYNYFVQRAFSKNEFEGLGTYIRNMTRDMVCTSNATTDGDDSWALAYRSDSARTIPVFEDGFGRSSLAAALFLNILLPAVTSPPSPDALPIDHRMLTVIMCVELVVAFGVALGCVFLSVYFVANRPREKRASRASAENARSSRRKRNTRSDRSESSVFSSGNESQSSFVTSADLEEGLLSEEDDSAYGSFNREHGEQNGAETPGGTWQFVKEALATISPW